MCVVYMCVVPQDQGEVLVGTQSCEILHFKQEWFASICVVPVVTDPAFELSREKAEAMQAWQCSDGVLSKRSLLCGHFSGELWGLAVSPVTVREEYCTVGDDKFLRLWSSRKKCQKVAIDLGAVARCCAYSPDGSMIGNFLLIYICNFHVLNHFLLIYICKLHWN